MNQGLQHHITRRSFFLHALAGGSAWLSDTRLLAGTDGSECDLKLSDYPALQTAGGSVRLIYSSTRPVVLVTRDTSGNFFAMNAQCTHSGCTVGLANLSTGQITCPCHFSRFAIDGTRLSGPAPRSLARYPVTFDGSSVSVSISGIEHRVRELRHITNSSGAKLFAITFSAIEGARYEVHDHSPTLAAATPTATAFLLQPDSPTLRSQVQATATAQLTVYVPTTSQRGFFSIAMLLTSYSD